MTKASLPNETKPMKALTIIARVFSIIALAAVAALLYKVIEFGVLPALYCSIIIAVLAIIIGLLLVFSFRKAKKIWSRIILIILSLVLILVSGFGFLKLSDTILFLNKNFGVSENVDVYNILVSVDSSLNESSSLDGREIIAYRDITSDNNRLIEKIKSSLKASVSLEPDMIKLIDSAVNDKEVIIALNAGAYESFLGDNSSYKGKLKIIKTVELEAVAEESESLADITTTPFAVYLSGIDTRSGTLPTRSLSDVNIVALVNPVEKKVLLVSIPRDYYVHLSGTDESDLNDKLTHAGSLGGVQLSKATISDLLDVDINYYVRVNFNFVQNLVDAIGGITVYSDVDYPFSCGGEGTGCVFNPGNNPVDGRCALAFVRERHAYSSGDRHRGENQEQVISLVLDKLTSSTTLLSRYSDILSSLTGTFETNLESEDITKFVKAQLADIGGWKVETKNLDGSTGAAYTYSYRSQYLSVMFPDEESISSVKEKIKEYGF